MWMALLPRRGDPAAGGGGGGGGASLLPAFTADQLARTSAALESLRPVLPAGVLEERWWPLVWEHIPPRRLARCSSAATATALLWAVARAVVAAAPAAAPDAAATAAVVGPIADAWIGSIAARILKLAAAGRMRAETTPALLVRVRRAVALLQQQVKEGEEGVLLLLSDRNAATLRQAIEAAEAAAAAAAAATGKRSSSDSARLSAPAEDAMLPPP